MSGHQLIVVGGGIAGSAAALRAAQYNLRTAWILGDRRTAKSSRGEYVHNIDNMIGVHEGVLKEKIVEVISPHSEEAAEAVRQVHFHIGTRAVIDETRARVRSDYGEVVDLVEAAADRAAQDGDRFVVETAAGAFHAPYLVLATGVTDRQPHIQQALPSGRTLDAIHWVFPYANHEALLYCVRCEGHLTAGTPTAVIGSSAAAGEVALMLHERYATPVTLLTHGEPPALPDRTRRLLEIYGIPVRTGRLAHLRGVRAAGALCAIELTDGTVVAVRFAFIVLGLHRVFNDLAVQLGCDLERGTPRETAHVLVDGNAETSLRGCFAVGDMATHADGRIRKQVYTAQEYAVRALDRIDGRVRAARRAALLA